MYTESKDDYLDEDPAIPSQRIALLSILSPNTVNAAEGTDWTIKGLKIRGVFESEEAAQSRLEYLTKLDDYHHIFTAPVGRWCPWDDNEENAENIKYTGNEKLNNLMKKHREQTDKVRNNDVERQVNARQNATRHQKMMAKRAKKIEKKLGKTTEEIVAKEIVMNDVNTMQNMSADEMNERIALIKSGMNKVADTEQNIIENIIIDKSTEIRDQEKEEKVALAMERNVEVDQKIMAQESTVDKLELECAKVREQLEQLKSK